MKALTIVKIGGNVVDNPESLSKFLLMFNKIEAPKILIHGGGILASEISAKLGIETKMHNGRRITDAETLKVCTMVYAGWINKSIVAQLQKIGCNSLGLSGADAGVIPAKRRSPDPVDFGFVGDISPEEINTGVLVSLLGRGITPVFCAITHDRNGSLLNTNADTMASGIAVALSGSYYTRLIFCFEKEGVLYDPKDEKSVIPLITKESYTRLKNEGVVSEGMLPKLDNAFFALERGVSEVYIKKWSNLSPEGGTMLRF
ncbi:MAG: acetylglutamate kinase [Bacteroidales bacterium]|jgi:acetylglutamate kinase|nr:acetylglutamate kinase [Bacteroidales bacterium]MDD2280488.1 acetylglutamate kinase [Bacteroidales bacterium]MDD4491268.1 acetylglutamate kinase [Bacteroidales bacterium]HNW48504.1 acetylglutamate kinase [Bacteroidales bacterium]HPS95322.1 acetylglutamate kinase [Bacteroidales bacterium]